MNKENIQIVEDIRNSMNSILRRYISVAKYIKLKDGDISLLEYEEVLPDDREKVLYNIPKRYRKRLLKQGYIIHIYNTNDIVNL